jgi:putative acetyltransferase
MTKKSGGPALAIRGIEADDAEAIAAIMNSGNVIYNTLQLPYTSLDFTRDRLENLPEGDRFLVAVMNDRVVGQLGLHLNSGRRAHAASLGMMVHADIQGQGVGRALMEAAVGLAERWLNISRIELEVYTDNAAALALYKAFGFEIEGTLHDYAFRDGHFVDAYLMARVRDEGP